MKRLVLLLALIFSLFNARSANAIIFLPAIILIPVAKVVALIIAGFSVPALGMGAVVAKFSRRPVLKMVLGTMGLLMVAAFVLGLFIKLINPDRPLF